MSKIAKKNGRVKKNTAKATSQVFNSMSASANTLSVKDSGKALESTVGGSVAPLLDTSTSPLDNGTGFESAVGAIIAPFLDTSAGVLDIGKALKSAVNVYIAPLLDTSAGPFIKALSTFVITFCSIIFNFLNPSTKPSLSELFRIFSESALNTLLKIEAENFYKEHYLLDNGKKYLDRNGSYNKPYLILYGYITVSIPRFRYDVKSKHIYKPSCIDAYSKMMPEMKDFISEGWLNGLSTNSFTTVLATIMGKGVAGLSSATISRIKKGHWNEEIEKFNKRVFFGKNFEFIYADAIYHKYYNSNKKLTILALIGIDKDGNREVIPCE
jgi:hypothetical protein